MATIKSPKRKDQGATLRKRMQRLLAAVTKCKKKIPQNESDPVAHAQQQSNSFILPEDLLWNILLWSWPNDDDQSIWLWLCRVSGTCMEFRRLVRMEKIGTLPCSLLPSVFKLLSKNEDYLNEGPNQVGLFPSRDTDFLRVELMKTIRRSKWMGSQLKSIHSYDNDDA